MWGLTEDVHKAGYNRSYPQDNVFLTSLTGFEVGRQPMPSMLDEQEPPESPTHRERCPQNFFDPVLQKFASRQKTVSFRYNTEYLSHQQDDSGVSIELSALSSSAVEKITAKYLVGCDGANSVVRNHLGIEMHGQGILTYTTNVIFESKNLNGLHNKKPGYRYMFVGGLRREWFSVCSEISRASSTSMPRYRTVDSSLACPRSNCTARRFLVRR